MIVATHNLLHVLKTGIAGHTVEEWHFVFLNDAVRPGAPTHLPKDERKGINVRLSQRIKARGIDRFVQYLGRHVPFGAHLRVISYNGTKEERDKSAIEVTRTYRLRSCVHLLR